MKKLHHFKKINSDFLPVRTYFSKITLIVIAVWVITIASLGVNAQGIVVTGSFYGQVFDNSTGKPISGVQVTFILQDTGVQVTTSTDEKGQFRKSALGPGLYTIQFTASRYQSLEIVKQTLLATELNVILPPPVLIPTTVERPQPIGGTRPTAKNSPKVRPKAKKNVISEIGNLAVASVPNAEIIVKDLENGQIYKNKILSNELLCVFDRLPAKKYRISASLEGYKPMEKEIELKENQTLPLTLNLLPNETSSRILSQVGKYYALVIGNNDYRHLPKLNTAETDAKAVNSILQKRFGFETKLLLNATRESGKEVILLPLPPLRTVLASFPAHGSSLSNAL